MKFKFWVAVLLSLVASGYIVQFGFWAMNQANDLLYVGGMFAILFWFGFLTYCWKKILRRRKDEASKSTVGGNSGSSAVGLH